MTIAHDHVQAAIDAPIVVLSGDTLFSSDSAALKPQATSALRQAAEAILTAKAVRVTIRGRADAPGVAGADSGLSLERAKAIKRWLVQRKVEGAAHFAIELDGGAVPDPRHAEIRLS